MPFKPGFQQQSALNRSNAHFPPEGFWNSWPDPRMIFQTVSSLQVELSLFPPPRLQRMKNSDNFSKTLNDRSRLRRTKSWWWSGFKFNQKSASFFQQDCPECGANLGSFGFNLFSLSRQCLRTLPTAPPYKKICLCQNLKMEEVHFSVSSLLYHLVASTVVVALMVSHWF